MQNNEIAELREILLEIQCLMKEDGEKNWIRGINACIDALGSDPGGDLGSIQKARSIYSSMHGGNGSFSDYFIWDDDPEERKKKNKMFMSLKCHFENKLSSFD